MAFLPMLPLFLSIILNFPLDPGLMVQEPAPPTPILAEAADPLAVPVLIYKDRETSALEVIDRIAPEDEQLRKLLQTDAAYRAAYLASPRFQSSVRAYADLLRLNELGVREVPREKLLAEARAYAADRKSRFHIQRKIFFFLFFVWNLEILSSRLLVSVETNTAKYT